MHLFQHFTAVFLYFFLLLFVNGEGGNFTVFGYLPEYRLNNFDYDGAFQSGLTHLIFFSLEVDPISNNPIALDRLPSKREVRRARAAADKVGGKLLISFGGNARSQGFSEMTKTRKTRVKFLAGVNKLLVDYKFDGVDYNWEYPRNYIEWKNWGHLLRESKGVLLENKSKNTVTFTMYLDKKHFQVIDQYKLLEHADYLHCMAYDSRGKHSTIEFAQQGIELAKTHLGENFKKWTLGLPFYGRNVRNGEPVAFYDIAPIVRSRKATGDLIDDVYYNSKSTITFKTQMAIEAGVGGVMIWELGQDVQPFYSKSLLSGIRTALPRRPNTDEVIEDDEEL